MTRVSELTAAWAAGVLNRDYGHPQERENARLLMGIWETQTLRTITCKECDGYGGWEADERVYGFRECTACAGRGEIEIVEP